MGNKKDDSPSDIKPAGNQTTLAATPAVTKEVATEAPTENPEPTIDLSNIETIHTLSSGHYTAGIDIPIGKSNVTAVEGDGNLISSNIFDGGINEMFGTDKAKTGYYTSEFSGLKLESGDVLSVTGGLTVKLEYTKITGPYEERKYDKDNAVELTNGNYSVGDDIPAGTYNLIAVSGDGNISSSNIFEGGINEMFGTDKSKTGYYTKEFHNLILEDGDTFEISGGLKISFIPSK